MVTQIRHYPVWQQWIFTFSIAVIGVAVFYALNLPLPFMFGPMAASLIAALSGGPLKGFGQVSVAARTVLGVASGASFTPALMAVFPQMMVSLALIPVFIMIIGLVGVPFFRRVWGFDAPTAYYCAMPGGLQDMVIFGTEAGGDPRALSLIQATRVLIIVTLAPIILTTVYDTPLTNPIGAPAADIPIQELIIMTFAALVGWKGAEKMGVFGASILGPLAVAAVLSLTGVIHTRPPREAILIAQFFIGCGIGVYFIGVTWAELRRIVVAGVAYVFVLVILATAFTSLVGLLGFNSPVATFLAFAPGGQAEMTVLAIVTGADLGFVVTHHLMRMICVIVGAPFVAAVIAWQAKRRG